MRIIVTGASGFLGSWICRVLSSSHEVVALVRKNSSLKKIFDLQNLHVTNLIESSWGDYIFQECPDILILADWWGVGNEHRNDLKQFDNVERIRKLVCHARDSGVKTIIGVGSQAELGSVQSIITEGNADNSSTLYGKAKIETRIMIENELRGSNVRFVWMRVFSTYGPLDEGSWLIPRIVDTLSADKVMKMTKGEQQWSYLHAFDLALAFAKAVDVSGISGIVNVGNPETIRIRDAALTIGKILGKYELIEFGALDYRTDEVMKLQPLCETLVESGWYPSITFEQGAKQTAEWLQRKSLTPILDKNGNVKNFNLPLRT